MNQNEEGEADDEHLKAWIGVQATWTGFTRGHNVKLDFDSGKLF